MELSDHELIYYSRKTSLLKLNEDYEISFWPTNGWSTKFSDYSNHTCVNDAYQYFVAKFLSAVDSVAPIRTLRVKYNTKPRFDIDVLNAIWNRESTIIRHWNW